MPVSCKRVTLSRGLSPDKKVQDVGVGGVNKETEVGVWMVTVVSRLKETEVGVWVVTVVSRLKETEVGVWVVTVVSRLVRGFLCFFFGCPICLYLGL